MAELSELEVSQLEAHLITSGLLGGFTDLFGDTQPEPMIHINELRLDNLEANQRAVMIRTVGGVSNPTTRHQIKQRNMMISVVGMQSEDDSIIVNGFAEDIESWLVNNPFDGMCLSNISSSGVSGPFTTEDSRRVYDISLLVTFNITRPSFTVQS